MNRAREEWTTVFAPATIGNVGPGFDVLGLCLEGLGDHIAVRLIDGPSVVSRIEGRDAADIPKKPEENAAVIAAISMLQRFGIKKGVELTIDRELPLSGGLGGSAAASVGGALAAAIAAKIVWTKEDLFAAALAGESAVAGSHLDNIAPCVLGGLTLVRPTTPPDVIELTAPTWWVALVTPNVRVTTKDARAVLPAESPRAEWIMEMANTAALVTAFARADESLAKRALHDVYAEPRRAALIPGFHAIKQAALDAGALGSSISGAGPTIFALASTKEIAKRCQEAMVRALPVEARLSTVLRIADRGAHQVPSKEIAQ